MQISLNFRSKQPIYMQIVEQVRLQIARGELKVGDQLPTVRQLATDLRVNFNTVARAYRLLDESSLISTQHGRGTYVWETPTEEVSLRLRRQGLEELVQNYINEALSLGYSVEEVSQALEQHLQAKKERIL